MNRHARFARAEDKITCLSTQGLDMVAFWRACTPVLADAGPHYMGPCCYTLDPASRLMTSHFQEGMPEFPPEWAAMEYAEDDVNHFTAVSRSARGLSTEGYTTTDIAERLVISVHTVQEHLKNVFAKTGVRARRDLVTKIFFSHYEPRLRDNERRAVGGRPLRGGPAATTGSTHL
jgi:hypothetical protein